MDKHNPTIFYLPVKMAGFKPAILGLGARVSYNCATGKQHVMDRFHTLKVAASMIKQKYLT